MPIVASSRWKADPDRAATIARELAPHLKEHGAERVSVGIVNSGQHAGDTILSVVYPDWETFGKAMQAQRSQEKVRQILSEVIKNGHLQGTSVVGFEEL
jgi:hypothetical protein